MFTGLIQSTGVLKQVLFEGEAGRLVLHATFPDILKIGESIAVNGICLTLAAQDRELLTFDILQETFQKTALRDKPPGAHLNLERALRMGDPLGGHLVSGHVDGTGTLQQTASAGRDKLLRLIAPELCSQMVPKGSIAVDGISLTLVDLRPENDTFSVHVVPHTWAGTTLSDLKPGDRVNLETDMIGKYVRASLQQSGSAEPSITWDKLRTSGFLDG